MSIIDKVNDRVDLLSYFLFFFFVLLLMEVVLRYFFNSPTVWANELAQMLFGNLYDYGRRLYPSHRWTCEC